jgi:DNA-binding response OmpR family regulator/DNA-binding CsgD family transcriptional regulator
MADYGFERDVLSTVLIVDDVPENLAVLHDALDESGYLVLVATNGDSALQSVAKHLPDVILLDAVMPGIDGFEVCRRLRDNDLTNAIPIIFMTGLTESEHVVAAFAAGGTDYVTKPIKPSELLARIAAHVHRAKQAKQARTALDAFGQATFVIDPRRQLVVWQTDLARVLLRRYAAESQAFTSILTWLTDVGEQFSLSKPAPTLKLGQGATYLVLSLSGQTDELEWIIVAREVSDTQIVDMLMQTLILTPREAEVLYWVIHGKTNRDIGDILGGSPRTVNKHLEHIFAKLGVETRTAAASLALKRIGMNHP